MCLCVILFRWTLCWTFFRFSSQWIQISVVIFNTWFNSSPNNWNGEKRVFQTLEKQNRSNLCTSHNIFLFIWDEHSLSPTILLLYRCALTITNLRWYPFLKKKMNKFANKTFFFCIGEPLVCKQNTYGVMLFAICLLYFLNMYTRYIHTHTVCFY